MKTRILVGLMALAGNLVAQAPEPAPDAPVYRGFFPGMTVAQLQEAAGRLNLTVKCVPVFDAVEVFGLCQTPSARALIETSTAPVTQFAILAGLGRIRDVVSYVVVLEPDATSVPSLLRERSEAWGKPQARESELVSWGRGEYGMAVSLGNARRAVIVGYGQGPGPGLTAGIGIVDDPPRTLSCGSMPYPDGMRAQGISGRAVMRFIVGKDGTVEDGSIKVMETDHVEFGAAATSFIQSCRFKPGRAGEWPIRVVVQQTVNFAR